MCLERAINHSKKAVEHAQKTCHVFPQAYRKNMLKKLNQLFHILSPDPRILPLHFFKKTQLYHPYL